jgi:hypothetical protein
MHVETTTAGKVIVVVVSAHGDALMPASSRHGHKNSRLRAWVMEPGNRQAGQPQNVTGDEPATAAVSHLDVEFAVFDLDERVAPFGSVIGVLVTGRHDDHADREGGPHRHVEQAEPVRPGVIDGHGSRLRQRQR